MDMFTTPEHLISLRQQLANDPHRPHYHFLPPAKWMNDPNGLIHWDNKYHLFYQHNPDEVVIKNMHWGHSVSEDLIHWTDLPIALTPTPGGPDEGGCWSGCAVNNDGVPTLIYTGVLGEWGEIQQTQCIATSSDSLLTWEKYSGNPVIGDIPSETKQKRDFRDPFVWREGDAWYMVLGSRIENVGGVVLLYKSTDLIHWDYLNPLLIGESNRNGRMWECPNFFPLGDKWVLIVSLHLGTRPGTVIYFVGDFKNYQFTPEVEGVLDYGYLYAPLTVLDNQGRRLLWGWLREGRTDEAQIAAGWSGVQSIPCELALLPDGRLNMQPVPELQILRGDHHHISDIQLSSLSGDYQIDVAGSSLEILADFEPGEVGEFGITLAASADGSERTCIVYNVQAGQLVVNREYSSSDATVDTWANMAPHVLAANEHLQLHILFDGSVIEIIANNRARVTSRIYPTGGDSQRLALFSRQSDGKLYSLDIWKMQSIWPSLSSSTT
jgi:beta-fructofuranosidase